MLNVHPVEAFADNYIWVLHDENRHALIVDPGDEGPVIRYLESEGLQPVAVLITHLHGDHTGGLRGLKARYPALLVYGPANERIAVCDQAVSEGDAVRPPGMDCEFTVMDVPGHTSGHVAYHGHDMLFCGDTLFACGCGRVFSGTFEQLHHSLQRIAQLPVDTQLYCAHEYTLDNIGFAKWVEPDSPALLQRERQDRQRREQGLPTVPSLLSIELATNPFLRSHEPVVREAAERFAGHPLSSGAEVFAAVRQWKDSEYD